MPCQHDRRRDFLARMLGAGAATALPGLAHGGSIGHLEGQVRVNGRRAGRTTVISPGDTVSTSRASIVTFVVGDDAYLLRENSRLTLRGPSGIANLLRLVSGALMGVFAPGRQRTVSTPVVTAGVRGTGVYAEVHGPTRGYFCTCYGEVALNTSRAAPQVVTADHHSARIVTVRDGRGSIEPAPMSGHEDDELVLLESLVGRRPPFA